MARNATRFQIWCKAWAVLESQDKGVKRVAYGASLFVTLAMIVNGGFILATRNKENREDVKARQEKAQVEDLRGLDPSVAKEILRQRAEERRQERKDQEREKALNDTGRKHETSMANIADGYISFWVFIVPFAVAALAKFTVLGAIALPGGASGYLPSRGQSPLGTGPTPAPPGPSNPAPQPSTSVRPRTTIPVGGNSGGKSPNPYAHCPSPMVGAHGWPSRGRG